MNQAIANTAAYHPAWQDAIANGPVLAGLIMLLVLCVLSLPREAFLWSLRRYGVENTRLAADVSFMLILVVALCVTPFLFMYLQGG